MTPAGKLIAFCLQQSLGVPADGAIDFLEGHFADHSQALPKALARANDRAWQALGVALAGDGFLDQVQVFFASRGAKGIREQVRAFLKANVIRSKAGPSRPEA